VKKSGAMKYSILPVAILLFCITGVSAQSGPSTIDSMTLRTFRQQDLQADFNFLRKALEETHPGLYRYTPKAVMTARLDSFYRQIRDNMPFYDYYRLMSALISNVRCAHTVILPQPNWQGFLTKYPQRLLPFGFQVIHNRVFLSLNQTTDTTLKPGYEIIAINDKPIGQVYKIMYQHLWGDGYSESLKPQTLNTGLLPMLYYLYVEQPDHFLLTCKDLSGKTVRFDAQGLPMKTLQENGVKNPVNKEIMRLFGGPRPDRSFRISKDSNLAIMNIRGYGGKGKNSLDTFLEQHMKELNEQHIGRLIIDLRHNPGGWDSSGVLLFTYLINKPSIYYRRQHTITDSSEYLQYSDVSKEDLANIHEQLVKEPDGTFSLKPQYTAGLPLQYPKPNHYTGKIYFLINGGSGSTTSEFIAAAQGNQLGVFVGEESGGAHEGGNGGTFLHLVLPATKIAVTTPLVYYDNGGRPQKVKGYGTLPDYDIPEDMNYALQGRDAQREFLLKLIMKSK